MKRGRFLTWVGALTLLLCLLLAPALSADTGDIMELMPACSSGNCVGGYDVRCPGMALGIFCDVDNNAAWETMVVFTTITGETYGDFFSFIDSHCGGTYPFTDRFRMKVHFIDMLAAGFVAGNPATWTYKRVYGIETLTSHDLCTNGAASPYLAVQAYRNLSQTDPITGTRTDGPYANSDNWEFSDAVGIKELYVSTDFCENMFHNLYIRSSPPPAVANPQISPPSGAYATPQTVTLTCSTAGAAIHYTTNGADPTEASPAYALPLTIGLTCTVKARAYRTGWAPSGIVSATYTMTNPIVYVRGATGNDANDGFSWAHAKKTIQAGINLAVSGTQVWVAAGSYTEHLTLKSGVKLYGGFSGSEALLAQRNWPENTTTVDATDTGRAILVADGADSSTRIDGFTITGGSLSPGAGIYCHDGSPVIANNLIHGNTASSLLTGGYGGGVCCDGGSAQIIGNVIADNGATSSSPTSISSGGGIAVSGGSQQIIANTIVSNSASSKVPLADNGGGIDCSGTPVIANNIICFNSSGIYRTLKPLPALRNNDVYLNKPLVGIVRDYIGISAGQGDISADPEFPRTGYHLTSESPCIDKGWAAAPYMPALDMDVEPRVNRVVDIGADEYWSSSVKMTIHEAKLSPDGATVGIADAAVTSAITSFFYIEEDTRASGLRVTLADHGMLHGWRADVFGVMATNSAGERYLNASSALYSGTKKVDPVVMTCRSATGGPWNYNPGTGAGQMGYTSGYGLNSTGLRVTVAGKITWVGPSYTALSIEDGSFWEPAHRSVVRIWAPTGALPGGLAVGKWVKATGVLSCDKSGTDINPWVLTQGPGDVVVAGP